VSERPKVQLSKSCVGESPPWVQIPPSPPVSKGLKVKMPKIELTDTHMLVKLTLGEKIFGMHGDFKIPAALIRGAVVADKNVWKTFGSRIGTAIPGWLVYGHYWQRSSKEVGPGGWTFALWRSNRPSVSITLVKAPGQPYKRIVLSTSDAQKLADQINDAIVAC